MDCGKLKAVLDKLRENSFPAKEKVVIQSTALTRELGAGCASAGSRPR